MFLAHPPWPFPKERHGRGTSFPQHTYPSLPSLGRLLRRLRMLHDLLQRFTDRDLVQRDDLGALDEFPEQIGREDEGNVTL